MSRNLMSRHLMLHAVAEPAPPPRLHICLLGYRSNPYSGGQGVYIKSLSSALADMGLRVDVISGQPYPELDPRVNLIKLPGLNLFEADNHVTALRPRHLLSFTDFFEWFSMLTGGFAEPYTFGRRLVKYFKKHKPQYDIVHDNQSLSYGTLKLQRMGIPIITTIHHPITSDLKIALQSAKTWQHRLLIRRWHSFLRMQKKVVKQLEHVVTVSKASQVAIADAFAIPKDKIHVVHNGIDTERFKPNPNIRRKTSTIMTTTSADVPLKGLPYLLRAIALLADDMPDLKLNVLGKLQADGSTVKLIKKLGLCSRIRFFSGISTTEIADLYAQATIAVVPSIYEGFGLPAGEAMACSVPVISTDGGALPEIIGDGGIIVPAGDHLAIADAIRALLADEAGRQALATKARQRILRSFTWDKAAQDLLRLYLHISGHAPLRDSGMADTFAEDDSRTPRQANTNPEYVPANH